MGDRHVVVIGAGVVGLCAADALVARGCRVTVLEREATWGNGCSFGNGGLIVPSHFVPLAAPGMVGLGLRMMRDRRSPFGVQNLFDLETLGWMARFARSATKRNVERAAPLLRDLNLQSRQLFEEMSWQMEFGYAKRGMLMLSRTQAGQDGEAHLAEDANRLGLKADVLDRAALAAFDPAITMDAVGAVFFHDDAHLTPPAFMRALRERVVAAGVEIREGVEVTGARRGGSRVEALSTSQGEVAGDEYVLATGTWAGKLGRAMGLRMPMAAGRGFGITIAKPPEMPTIPAIFTEGRIAVTPMLDGLRFVGTMELGQPNLSPESPRVDGMRENITRYYPKFSATDVNVPAWCGLRPCTPDGLPYLGRPSTATNVVVAAGHAMVGMSLGPITGQLVADLIVDGRARMPIDILAPDRFG